MRFSYRRISCALFSIIVVFGQEPSAEPVRGGRGGPRGNIREFLGLGPAPDPAAAKKGEPTYKQNCGGCHGENARGAQAPSLVRSVAVLHDEKGESIGPIIRQGRPGMPPFTALSDEDILNIRHYIFLQIELAANRGTYRSTYANQRNQTTGDAKQGQAFFDRSCVNCHSVTGDLAKIGTKFPQSAAMQARFLWPAAFGPAKATITEVGGTKVIGTIRNLTDFDVSLVDGGGNYHYWPRAKVTVNIEDKLGGHRALLPKYSDADIHNLAAYLVTVK